MTLDHNQKYPQVWSFILKLDGIAVSRGEIAGRLENLVSGRRFEFSGGEQLLAGLAGHASRFEQESGAGEATGIAEDRTGRQPHSQEETK